jgi:uncharacterized protein (DUF2126 family)
MRAITEGLYEDAHYTRLVTEKFMLDGRHTGTGGGNHVVLGGRARPTARSCAAPICCAASSRIGSTIPLCRISFSGCSSAPTSQAPRIDERAHDSCYELELAFTQADRGAAAGPAVARRSSVPQFADRRHGNTHRAEICIDKLYSPTARQDGSGSSSSARSRCRRIRA